MADSLHVAIIMDGNGRWAQARGWPRMAGHKAGMETVRRIVEAAPERGITDLTLYAFSSDNWKRPKDEVTALMRLLAKYLREETERCAEKGVRISAIGRRDRLAAPLVSLIEESEERTAHCDKLRVRAAIDYSARERIIAAVQAGATTPEELAASMSAPDVDLLIRTGGEQRLSDFLLWESAYAELFFSPVMWPDFQAADLDRALLEFRSRQRRFGGVLEPVARHASR